MSIASEIADLNTNLQAAKNAVTAKGGTVGDTGLAGLAAEIGTIPNEGGSSEPSSGGHITDYNTSTGVISGNGFGSDTGTVYLLDRATNTYVAQPTSSWSSSSITLTTPIDASSIEGTTSLSVVDANGEWATKWLITGGIALTGWAKVYVQDSMTRAVRTISITDQSDFNKLFDSEAYGNAMSIATTIGTDTFYRDEIVGVQFGPDLTATAFTTRGTAYHFLPYADNLNQPIVFPSEVNGLCEYFGYSWFNFNQPLVLSSNITDLPGHFFTNAYNFDQPIDLSKIVTIGDNVFQYMFRFNQPLDLSSVTTIGNYFLAGYFYQIEYRTMSFNSEIKFSSLTSIGQYFLAYDSSFNTKLTFPNSLATIGTYFMDQCCTFNNPMDLSNTAITQLPDFFMANCTLFNSSLTLPSGLTSIGNNCFYNWYTFNQPLTLPSTLLTIGNNVLSLALSFNQPLVIPQGVTTLGTNFLNGAQAMNQKLTLPSSLTSIGSYLLKNSDSFCYLETNTSTTPTSNAQHTLSTTYSLAKMYVRGVTITGSGAANWVALGNRTSSPYRKLINGN